MTAPLSSDLFSFHLHLRRGPLISLRKVGTDGQALERKMDGAGREFLDWGGKWCLGTNTHTQDVCPCCLRTDAAAAVPVWRAPPADQSETQAPTRLPFSPGARAPQPSRNFCRVLLTGTAKGGRSQCFQDPRRCSHELRPHCHFSLWFQRALGT